jgi:hypothetical protein
MRVNSLWTYSDGGETVRLWGCAKCGAAVKTADRERHEEWHKRLND